MGHKIIMCRVQRSASRKTKLVEFQKASTYLSTHKRRGVDFDFQATNLS
jgi:hypothetical protein